MFELSPHFQVHALRYARSKGLRSRFFYNNHFYQEPDAEYPVDFFFWLARNDDTTILVDCGFDAERGSARGRPQDVYPLELLNRMDVRPEAVDHVIISHMHYDHVGNLGLFPNAQVTISRKEFDYWTTPGQTDRNINSWVVAQEEVTLVLQAQEQGRLHLAEDEHEVVPGINLLTVGGHTPGQALTRIATATGDVVLASDAAHFLEEIERDRPFNLFHDLDDLHQAYGVLRSMSQTSGTSVIAGHDASASDQYQQVATDCFDLTHRRG